MSVNIIYKQADKSEITDAMLEAAIKAGRDYDFNGEITTESKLSIVRKAMEAARKPETIERIEVVQEGIIFITYSLAETGDMFMHKPSIGTNFVLEETDIIPLGEALIKLGKQVKGE